MPRANKPVEADQSVEQVNPVPHQGDHDRVQMLSLRPDGTPDQHNPEIIGDKDTAVRAAKEQFGQQAVSAVDVAEVRGPVTLVGTDDGGVEEIPATTGEDPSIQKRVEAHQSAADAAEKAAERAVESLHKGE